MKKLIDEYRNLSFEDRTVFNARFSIIFNGIMAIAKFILAIFFGVFFFVNGVVNILIMVSKSECYLGIKNPNKRSFRFRNNMIGFFLMAAGLQYTFYMARLLLTDVSIMKYDMILGICIAIVSFVEIGVAIKGLFNASGKGHYYRNIKLINLCSACTAIVLTEIAIMSFASDVDSRMLDGLFGVVVGAIIILIGLFVLIAPKVSIIDKEHQVYKLKDNVISTFEENVEIKLTSSRFYADFYYKGIKNNDIIDGHIIKGKNPIFKWNIFIVILVMVLSEILIFPYAIGALVNYFKGYKLIKKLDIIMSDNNYIKVGE
ncbi:MAG: hypothetical protein E7176_04065 [Erysipelotrichaceae bacterium]|nr:hypothetical protein [Erysipelotrichaceae bacterium]